MPAARGLRGRGPAGRCPERSRGVRAQSGSRSLARMRSPTRVGMANPYATISKHTLRKKAIGIGCGNSKRIEMGLSSSTDPGSSVTGPRKV